MTKFPGHVAVYEAQKRMGPRPQESVPQRLCEVWEEVKKKKGKWTKREAGSLKV